MGVLSSVDSVVLVILVLLVFVGFTDVPSDTVKPYNVNVVTEPLIVSSKSLFDAIWATATALCADTVTLVTTFTVATRSRRCCVAIACTDTMTTVVGSTESPFAMAYLYSTCIETSKSSKETGIFTVNCKNTTSTLMGVGVVVGIAGCTVVVFVMGVIEVVS